MIVMALDHANLFIAHAHPRLEFWSGQFPTYTSALTFLTRFVTHLAAPGFFFLMGAGMALFADARRRAGWNASAIARHFIERGLLLIALQLLVEDPAWQIAAIVRGEGSVFPIYFGVLYGLGAAMMAAALTLNLNSTLIAGLSLAALLAPEILIPYAGPWLSSPLLQLLLMPGQTRSLRVYYPVIPWLGLAGLGMVFGRWLLQDQAQAYQRAMIIGGVMLALFFVVRSPDGFGNMRPADSSARARSVGGGDGCTRSSCSGKARCSSTLRICISTASSGSPSSQMGSDSPSCTRSGWQASACFSSCAGGTEISNAASRSIHCGDSCSGVLTL